MRCKNGKDAHKEMLVDEKHAKRVERKERQKHTETGEKINKNIQNGVRFIK
jgi:hypothetical protein